MIKKVKVVIGTVDGDKEIEGELTTDHSDSSDDEPVFVDTEGQVYDRCRIKAIIEEE